MSSLDPTPQPLAKSAKDRWSIIAGILAILIAFVALFVSLRGAQGEVEDQAQAKQQAQEQVVQEQAEKVNLAEQVREACQAGGETARELGSACEDATQIVKQGDPGPQGPQGPAGPPPSDAQVQQAVALYCSGGACDGEDATEAQVRAAVATYCNANGECRGPEGETGKSGADGATGATGPAGPPGPAGPQGPGPSDEQVQAAVAAYCGARNGCRGPEGPPGPQGEPGPTCPAGYIGKEFSVETGESPINTDTRSIFACVPA